MNGTTKIAKATSNGHLDHNVPPLDHDLHNGWGTLYSANAIKNDDRTRLVWEEYAKNPARVEGQYHKLLNEYTTRFASFFNGYWPITFHAHVSDVLIPTTLASLILNTASTCPLIVEDPVLSPLLKDDPEPEKVQQFVRDLLGWTDVHVSTPKLATVQGIYGCAFGPLAHSSEEWEYQIIGAGPAPFSITRDDFSSGDTLLAKLRTAKEQGCVTVICDLVNASDGSIFPPEYYRMLRICCAEARIFLLVDEAMTAIRCGAPWVCQRPEYSEVPDLQPDLVAFGKGMGVSGIAINFGGMMMRHLAYTKREQILQTIRFWRSMVTRPIAIPVLLEAMAIVNVAEAEDWPARSEKIGRAFREFILRHAGGEGQGKEVVRGIGAFIAVDREFSKRFRVMAAFRRKSSWARWLPKLDELGASVTIKRWLDIDIIDAILSHDVVNFLWAEDYIRHPTEFAQFLDKAERAISEAATHTIRVPRVINNFALVRWNMDKRYLLDMHKAGFDIPATEIVDPGRFPSVSALHERILRFQSSGSIVLKPSISASSANTHLVADIGSLSAEDITYLEGCTKGRLESSLVVQQFEPAIASGEYSFVFVGGKLCNAALKTPKDGEFRCQTSFGGRICKAALEDIDPRAVSTVKGIFDTLRKRFGEESTIGIGYVRIDGVVTADRPFVLMEIEAIEPELGLEYGGLNEMLSLIMDG
ncbi:pyridoxal phosphate-dependent transferase [Aspergillus insuetus]